MGYLCGIFKSGILCLGFFVGFLSGIFMLGFLSGILLGYVLDKYFEHGIFLGYFYYFVTKT